MASPGQRQGFCSHIMATFNVHETDEERKICKDKRAGLLVDPKDFTVVGLLKTMTYL